MLLLQEPEKIRLAERARLELPVIQYFINGRSPKDTCPLN